MDSTASEPRALALGGLLQQGPQEPVLLMQMADGARPAAFKTKKAGPISGSAGDIV
ncbi:MAG TPA: hypothetical protein VNE63_15900 [Candidatus Acidoferrales bacterium]|nr:hypothetical protein [Candidatus Acidoferrales bacterium]